MYDRMSRVLVYTSSPRAKLESDRCWRNMVLDYGTPERPWPNTMPMCSKAAWFRARNSVDRGVAPPKQQPPRGARWVYGARPLSVANSCRVKKNASLTSSAHTSVSVRSCSALEVCRWITYLEGSSSSWDLRAGRTGPTVIALPWLQTALKRCKIVSA